MPTQNQSQPPAAEEAVHTPTPFPALELRGLPGSSSGFQIGYWCRITKDDDGNSMKVHYIPDPRGEFFIVVAEIPGMGKAHENREWAAFIARACNGFDSLITLAQYVTNEQKSPYRKQALEILSRI